MATIEELEQELARRQSGTTTPGQPATLEQLEEELARRQTTDGGGMTAANVVRQALGQGFALGFGDEIEAGVKSFVGYDYDKELKRIRRGNRAFERQNPGTAIGLNLAGGMGTVLIPGLGIANALSKAGKVGKAVSSVLPNAQRLASGKTTDLIKEGAKLGGIYGGVAGAGVAEGGLENRLTSAAITGGAGAALGGVATPVLGGLSRGVGAAYKAATATKAAPERLLAKRLQEAGFDTANFGSKVLSGKQSAEVKNAVFKAFAEGRTQKSVAADDTIAAGEKAVSRMYGELREKLGRDQTLIDVVGEVTDGKTRSLTGLARGANAIPSEGQATAAQRFARRTMAQQDGYADDIAEATGGAKGGATKAIRDKLTDLREKFSPEYLKQADEMPLRLGGNSKASQIFTEMRESPNSVVSQAFRNLENEARAKMGDFGASDGTYSFDLINEMQKLARRRAEKGLSADDAAAAGMYRTIRERILDATGDHFPGFAQLRKDYASEISDVAAYQAGADTGVNISAKGMELEQDAVKMMQKLRNAPAAPVNKSTGSPFKPGSKAHDQWLAETSQGRNVRMGFGDALIDDVSKGHPAANPGVNVNKTRIKQRIKSLLPKKDADNLIAKLEQRDRMRRTQQDIFGGSPTERIEQEIGNISDEADLAAMFTTGNVTGMWQKFGQSIGNSIKEKNASKLADTLSRMGPDEVSKLINDLSRIQPSIARFNNVTGLGPAALSVGIINAMTQHLE